MKILALDISSSCTGYALYNDSNINVDEWIINKLVLPEYYKGLTKNNLLMSKSLFWFNKEILNLMSKYRPDHVVAEDINIRAVTTMRTMAQFHAAASIAISMCNENIVLNKVHNATVRSEFGMSTSPSLIKTLREDDKKLNKKDASGMAMVMNANKKFGYDYKYESLKELSKKFKVDLTKILMTTIINKLFNMNIQFKDNDIADAVAVGWTFLKRRI